MDIKTIETKRPFTEAMDILSDKYDVDMYALSFAAVKNMVTDAEWLMIENSLNRYGFNRGK